MDPITQGCLGSACAQAILHKQPARVVWISSAIAAMAPDLDIFIRSRNEPLLSLLYHRHFTHSLFFIPIGAILVTLFLCSFIRLFRAHWSLTFLASLIGIATHGLLDACTSYGTVLYWPFSLTRVSWDIVSIIDPIVTFPLAIGTALSVIFFKRHYVLIAIFWVGIFLSFNTYQHHQAIQLASQYFQQYGNISRIRAIPEMASSTKWRVVTLMNDTIYTAIAYVPIWGANQFKLTGKYPQFQQSELPNFVIKSPTLMHDFRIFAWFTDGWLIRVPSEGLIIADARYIFYQPPIALWGIGLNEKKLHVIKHRFIKLENKK
jgi:inner membrane protein